LLRTVWFEDGKVKLIDQTKLPQQEIIAQYDDYKEVARAIVDMEVRGAPAIGVTAALGIALGICKLVSLENLKKDFLTITETFAKTRPTAVNLFWAINRMRAVFEKEVNSDISHIKQSLLDEALKIAEEDILINQSIGNYGAKLLRDGETVLTHCNAGALATVAYGTALGVIRAAIAEGKNIKVIADETRPLLQGARLTCWELEKDGIDVTLITDSMAGYLMKEKKIDKVIVGADRIAANGDTANKIGTYSVAVLAKANNIPFYIAAPISTIDLSINDGSKIPIEQRNADEVRFIDGLLVAPKDVKVKNPAFDVTENELISGIITEKGVARAPYRQSIKKITGG